MQIIKVNKALIVYSKLNIPRKYCKLNNNIRIISIIHMICVQK